MEQVQQKQKTTTTVCVDAAVRDFLAAEGESLGLSQRQVVNHIVNAYKHRKDNPSEGIGDERIISFMKQQEKMLLSPILKTTQSVDSRLNVLVDILKELD